MIHEMLWSEWRQHRWKYLLYFLLLNCPMLLVTVVVASSTAGRTPFRDLSNVTAGKYLAVALIGESMLLVWIFIFLTGLLAVVTFSAGLEDGSLFFMYEQPLGRWRYIAMKLAAGAFYMALATACALLAAPLIAFVLTLVSGKVTLAGTAGALAATMAAAVRAGVWCVLLMLAVYAGCALITALVPRWWLALGAAIVFVILCLNVGGDFFDFSGTAVGSGSVSASSNTAEWLKVQLGIKLAEFAPWKALPLAVAGLLAAAFSAATCWVCARMQLK